MSPSSLIRDGLQVSSEKIVQLQYANLYALQQLRSFTRAQMQRQKAREDSLMSEGEQKQRIELFISCRNLDDLDFITVTDSFLVVKLLQINQPEKIILKTKVYWNDLNPNYAETALVDFYFEIKQKLIFEVFHYDTPPKLVGRMETSVGEIFGSPEHGLVKDLVNKNKKAGKIIIRSQKEQTLQKKVLTLKFAANGLPNITWWYFFGGTNAFFRIFRKRQGDQLMVYQSQTIASTNPSWKEFRISERRLASKDANKDLDFRVYNFSKTGKHEVIASVTFRVGSFANGAKFQLLNKIKNPAGVLYLQKFQARTQYQFGDYLQKGLQLALITCIDFTASNGVPTDRKSLHFNAPGGSQYQKALTSVTSILLDYDYDKLVPVFGFGAKVKHPMLNTQHKVHHCFPINCNQQNPNLYQLDEIIKAYRNILPYLQLSGPTKFAELLKEAMSQCRDYKQLGTHYMILFILTDGEIHDKAEVIDLLIQCNTLPLSIIIVGIGEGQFTIMRELDDDNCQMVDSKGNATQRDLVQFVKFADFSNNGTALAKEVLEELPRQVSEYYQLMNMSPDDIASCYKQDDIMRVKEATGQGALMEEEPINPYDRI